ncbi:MAG: FIST N-terminal domain-containing protein [Proteocatella sp.]
MFKAKTGSSTNADAAMAGKEAARTIKSELSYPKMAFVYSGVQYNQNELLDAISSQLPGVPLIGNTSFTGVITNDGFISGEDGFVGILALEDDSMVVGIASQEKESDARAAGQSVAQKAQIAANKLTSPDYFYMVAPPGEEEFYLKGITDVIGRVPFFGGSAADNSISGDWLLYTNDLITADGVAVAFFYTDRPFANSFTGAYEETENVGIITKLDGYRTLVEIDGVPALKKYAQWAGVDVETLKGRNLLGYTITAPLGVKDRLGDLIAIRHPMNGNDDYSMAIGSNLAVGTAVIQMKSSIDGLIKSAGENIGLVLEKAGEPVGALHLVHCGGRRAGVADRIDELVAETKKAAGDIPFIMEFTFGEYGYEDDGNNTCGGLMLSFTAFVK